MMYVRLKSFVRRHRLLYWLAEFVRRHAQKVPIMGRGNRIVNRGILFNVRYNIRGNNNRVEIGQGTCLSDLTIYIRGDNHHLLFGENCRMSGGELWFEDHNCVISIGANTTIEDAHLAASEPYKSITLGNDCMLSSRIEIRTGDSHSILNTQTGQRINYAQNVVLGDHVWVGANAVILKGVKIDHNAIVSTGAIVTSNVLAHTLVAGMPARAIKANVDWLRGRIYGQADALTDAQGRPLSSIHMV
ncbi:MAG: acyltransferase [Cytophagales bacterium]|nr:MAG: acyltransferase [Cytophagales bacterium]